MPIRLDHHGEDFAGRIAMLHTVRREGAATAARTNR
jgi:hypothetical protein